MSLINVTNYFVIIQKHYLGITLCFKTLTNFMNFMLHNDIQYVD